MKKRVILSVIIIAVAIAGALALAYFSSFHKVSLSFSSDVTGASVHKEKGDIVGKLTGAGDISLQDGTYYIVPEGEKVSKDKIPLIVKDKDQSIAVDPDYSTTYLSSSLRKEQSAITSEITSRFPLVATNYTVQSGTLLHHGEWYGALLVQNVSDIRDERDFYRILLHKESNTWKVVKNPELVLTKVEFNGVPEKILDAVNQLSE